MPHEIRFASFNVFNLALPGARFYEGQEPYSISQYDDKISWLAQQIDRLDADVIGFQEIFSQDALRDVLARTRYFRDAHHAGSDPQPRDGPLTPSVALVSRLPFAGVPVLHRNLPRQLAVALPDTAVPMTQFTRPILQVPLELPDGGTLQAFVTHMKSKRPDWNPGNTEDDPYHLGMASLRSLIRRGTDALGLRYLLTDLLLAQRVPLVVMGDFNDDAGAVTTHLVMGTGRRGKSALYERLFDCLRIQTGRDPSRDVGYTHLHDGAYLTLDHVLVSEEFHPASRYAIGEVLEVMYLNDHLGLRLAAASDHGQVLVRIRLFGQDAKPA
ncbi:endonuclease/exonuclease/phosphatase family protein [Actimicrobium sp. CCC2.4]|uniref:endonuclease/exonuclease/phosphatase family protein n=1 Tax=Actimicrobium sp. CCC2.4 TaxID=3048606 RepID=UPI002AC8D60F|nr:endonuclease/exonuclease/phosphatase family protein [Actimicrobium sp. CCC2.4]MEB0137027.1 endonuclease/exonuclease/phosphatase family protein [Actimicrobium sp. CCC2.4]WPX32236.1 endonuclease/exonuclease/phosphatase family protein [Actimicrobium sp. CCC2.4]